MHPASRKLLLYSHPSEMEPLLPGKHRLQPLLEQAHDLTRSACRLAGMCPPGALLDLRGQLRSMHSYYSRFYGGTQLGERRVLAAVSSHQRLAWIHPFRDGNGRVARLHTHLVLAQLGLTNGTWFVTRGFARSQDAYYSHLAVAAEPRAGDLDGRGSRTERGLENWMSYVLGLCLEKVQFMTGLLATANMKEYIAACLAYEEQVVRQSVRSEALGALHHLFATQGELERADFKAMLGSGDRLATTQVSALLKRGLLSSDSAHGRLRFSVPQHALRFYFPRLWPEAEGQ